MTMQSVSIDVPNLFLPLRQLALPFLPGAAYSVTLITAGYPFDTIKTRLQLRVHRSMWTCVRETWRQEGCAAFYRGALMPLCTLMVKRPFEFAVFEKLNRRFKGKSYAPWLGGCLAGATSAVIGCPFSVVRVQMQATTRDVYDSFLHAASAIWRQRGLGGFYQGLTASLYKDIPFASVYLGTYGNMREALPKTQWSTAAAGATASLITWTCLQPLDTVKTLAQAAVLEPRMRDLSWSQRCRAVVASHGILGLWAGWVPVAMRSAPSSAAAMTAYECARAACDAAKVE